MKLLSDLKGKFSKDKLAFGLDIGTEAIKLVKLKSAKDTVELCGFSLEPTETDLVSVLKRIAQSQNLDIARISFSGSCSVIRYVNFLRMNKEELGQALKFEAQKHIPFQLEEVNFDSYILKDNLPDNKMFVLLAALKKESLNQRLKVLAAAGIKPSSAAIDSIALVNAFSFNYAQEEILRDKTVALLNIGATLSNLNILENGIPCLSRDVHIAGANFTQKIADTFGTDIKLAEKLKQNLDKEKKDKIFQAVESSIARIASEIRTSFDYYESQKAASVVKIFLSGGGSLFSAVRDNLNNLLGIDVEYWDPLKKISIVSNVDIEKIKTQSSQLAVAVGLALLP